VKINGFGSIPEILKAYNSQKRQQSDKARETANWDGEDTLVLSDQAREIKDLQAGLKDIKEVREEKVDLIKKEIGAGRYRVDALKVAEAIIRERLLDKQV